MEKAAVYAKRLLLINMLINKTLTHFTAPPTPTIAHKWGLTLQRCLACKQVIIAILIIMPTYYILFNKRFGSSFLESPKLQLNCWATRES